MPGDKTTEIGKICAKCGRTKSLTEFYKMKKQTYDVDSLCKKCRRVSSRRWHRKNKNYRKEYDARRWKEANKDIENARRKERYHTRKQNSRNN